MMGWKASWALPSLFAFRSGGCVVTMGQLPRELRQVVGW